MFNRVGGDNTAIGRPRIEIQKEDIDNLRALNFSWTKIAKILGVSRQTLYRRLEDYNIPCSDYSTISPTELDEVIKDIKRDHPNDGEVMVQGQLVALGIRVTRSELRASIHRVDHENTQLRRTHVIRRRQYSVDCPNSIWHIDGHHKLIRWRFVVHAGIDGFSRAIPYIQCATNNRASTVLSAFQVGVSRFGLPDRVRSDHGGENIDVWRYMLDSHNGDPQCILTGSSTHNERIERLWRDVHRCLLHFADTFRELESTGLLDTLNEVDMFSLHYVFLPRINKTLCDFKASWNNHGLSSEGNMTPHQLFVEGMTWAIQLNMPTATSVSSISQNTQANLPNESDTVQVPEVSFVPCRALSHELHRSVIPTQPCSDYGKQLYSRTIRIIGQHLLSDCNDCLT